MNSHICKKKTPSFSEHLHFSNRSIFIFLTRLQGQAKKLTSLYRLASAFLANKGPNNGNQHCRQEISDLDSFAPDEVDPHTENKAGANQ